jgi:cytoskeletal protein RodZ
VTEITGKIDLALQALQARPGSAELASYLRQLFAARVPEPEPYASIADVEMPSAEDLADSEVTEVAGRQWPWSWILIVLAVLLAMTYGWWVLAGRDRVQTDERSTSAPAIEAPEPAGVEEPAAEPRGETEDDPARSTVPSTDAPVVDAEAADLEGLVAGEFARRERELEERLQLPPPDEAAEPAAEAEPVTSQDDGPPASATTPGRPLH